MTIDSPDDIVRLKRIGRIVALTLKEMQENVRPGITTAELDEIGAAVLKQHGARSAPQLAYNFPGATCISINDEAAHGIPGSRQVQPGDLVNLDVSAELDEVYADAALTIPVLPVDTQRHNLVLCSQRALKKAIHAARAGQPINVIGRAVENEARGCGFTTIMDLGGHGVGRKIHEEPHNVANYDNPNDHRLLTEGMVLTIEPFITTGARRVYTAADGWTLKTSDGSLSAQCEHTLVITRGKPIIITDL
ncbi:MAG: type I methionyl aminopeptidase [Chloroflexi bacterium]|nr:MAG: type I methionyl aminopeptidase [Chloroflexota bacterium]